VPSFASSLGSPAPPLELPSATGEQQSLSQFRGRPVVVSFLGPAHCMFCRAHVIRLIQARRELEATTAQVLLVAYEDPAALMSQLFRDLQLPFTLLLDSRKDFYTRWGMGVAGWGAILRPRLYWSLMRMVLGGARTGKSSGEPNYLGGDFVIDRAGRFAFAHRQKSFYDRPPIESLLSALKQT
jgi:peroxiredoxin